MESRTENLLRQKTPTELLDFLSTHFGVQVPGTLTTIDDLNNASSLLATCSNQYTYLLELLSLAKIMCRESKRSGEKSEYEDMVDKKEIVSNFVDAVKSQYSAISRAVTIKMEINQELKMTGGLI